MVNIQSGRDTNIGGGVNATPPPKGPWWEKLLNAVQALIKFLTGVL